MKNLIVLLIDKSLEDKNQIICDFRKGLGKKDKNYAYEIINTDEENVNKQLENLEKENSIKYIISLFYDSQKDLFLLRSLNNNYLKNYRVSGCASFLENFSFEYFFQKLIIKNYYTTPYFSNFTHLVITKDKEDNLNKVQRSYYLNEIYGYLAKSFVLTIYPEEIEQAKKEHGIIFFNCQSYVTTENFKNLDKLFIGENALSVFNNSDFAEYTFNYNFDNKNLTITNLKNETITLYTHPFALLNAGAFPEDLTSSEIKNKIKFNRYMSMGYKLNQNIQ